MPGGLISNTGVAGLTLSTAASAGCAAAMTPAAFVRRPGRWIREMARKPDDTGGVISVAPNFAFDHAAARGVPKDGEAPLDLSNVKAGVWFCRLRPAAVKQGPGHVLPTACQLAMAITTIARFTVSRSGGDLAVR